MLVNIALFDVEIDDEDLDRVLEYNWRRIINGKSGHIYFGVYYHEKNTAGQRKTKILYLHRLLLNAPTGMEVDHISGNVLDCRKSNLRLCSHAKNCRNQKMNSDNVSGHKGVSWCKAGNKWRADIRLNGKLIYLGLYDNLKEASEAYNKKSQELFGEYHRSMS